jgi:hypothetical protein
MFSRGVVGGILATIGVLAGEKGLVLLGERIVGVVASVDSGG